MITEDYVSFDTAKLLKEKGFNEATNRYYNAQYDQIRTVSDTFMWHWNDEWFMKRVFMEGAIAIPTLQMAMKWLRENHRIIIVVDYDYDCTKTCYCYKIYRLQEYDRPESFPIKGFYYKDGKQIEEAVGNSDHIRSKGEYAKYEESCDAAIKYCLENLI